MPNTQQRLDIIEAHTASLSIGSDVDLSWLAKSTNGFSGADLACLCREAAFVAVGDGQICRGKEQVGCENLPRGHSSNSQTFTFEEVDSTRGYSSL